MKKILFLGNSSGTYPLLNQAKKQGLYTIVTDFCSPERSPAKLISDEYWMISTNDLDSLEKKCREENIQAVISGASDFNTGMAIKLCERLGLPCYCTDTVWNDSRDKVFFKRLAKQTGVPIPEDYILSSELDQKELNKIKYPVVVKPVDFDGNKGISFCTNQEELINGYRYAASLSDRSEIIVERMLSGVELFSYYALANGEASFLSLGTRLPQPGEPKFCYSMNTTISRFTGKYLEEMNPSVITMLKELGCRDGIACVQCMWDEQDDRIYAFEMCYCPEGSILLAPMRYVCDFDGIAWQIECALGVQHTVADLPKNTGKQFGRCANSYILFCNKEGTISEISGLDAIKELPNVELQMNVHIGDEVAKYRQLGFIMFDADNCDETCQMIEKINETVHVKNTKGEDMLIYFTDFDSLQREYSAKE